MILNRVAIVHQLCRRSFTTTFNHLKDISNGPAVLISRADQIHFNLALESYLMDVVKPKVPVFLWWRNNKNIVIGRNQNPWKECNNIHEIDIARRFSGGGAVYQDLGNSCFTFLAPDSKFDKTKNNAVILNVLKNHFQIDGEASGRNDLIVNTKKFSGAAFKHIKDPSNLNAGLSLHHGTILINTDFSALQKYLTPNKLKLEAKGVKSVTARVVNLQTLNDKISHEMLTEPLSEEFKKLFSNSGTPQETIILDQSSSFTADPEFKKILAQLTDWDWRFGKTPQFSHLFNERFDWGTIEVNLDVCDGMIKDAKIFTDCLIVELVPQLEEALKGCRYKSAEIKKCLEKVEGDQEIICQFGDWVCKAVDE